ncbi:uncharacterized protein LOC119185278 isoform X1 [Rhipicephalus microplus]|uniref:uncharacterized protein LOC119185278 isoform X1 n=1 Tax=Rhipicephalus microplus TaxID=6941 RepID=UPI003F6CC6DA
MVVNTSEYVWLHRQTYSNSFEMSSGKNNFSIETTCIRRVMTGLTSKEYNFTEIDVMELTNIGDNYTGIFIYDRKNLNHNMHPPTSMNVYESGRTKAEYQTILEYTEPDTYSCSVFTVYFMSNKITDDSHKCEMYIRESHLRSGPTPGCEKYFNQKCRGKQYRPYISQCTNKGNDIL